MKRSVTGVKTCYEEEGKTGTSEFLCCLSQKFRSFPLAWKVAFLPLGNEWGEAADLIYFLLSFCGNLCRTPLMAKWSELQEAIHSDLPDKCSVLCFSRSFWTRDQWTFPLFPLFALSNCWLNAWDEELRKKDGKLVIDDSTSSNDVELRVQKTMLSSSFALKMTRFEYRVWPVMLIGFIWVGMWSENWMIWFSPDTRVEKKG